MEERRSIQSNKKCGWESSRWSGRRERGTFSFLFAQKRPQGEEPELIRSVSELLRLQCAQEAGSEAGAELPGLGGAWGSACQQLPVDAGVMGHADHTLGSRGLEQRCPMRRHQPPWPGEVEWSWLELRTEKCCRWKNHAGF